MKKIILALVVAGVMIPVETAAAHLLTHKAARSSARAVCSQINQVPVAVNPYHCSVSTTTRRRSRHVIDVRLKMYDQADDERCKASVRVSFRGQTRSRWVRKLWDHTCGLDPFRTEAEEPPEPETPAPGGTYPAPPGPVLEVSDAEAHVRGWGEFTVQTQDTVYDYKVDHCTRRSSYQVDCLMMTWVRHQQDRRWVYPCWQYYYVFREYWGDGAVRHQTGDSSCDREDLRWVG